jgi:hypothetical protein
MPFVANAERMWSVVNGKRKKRTTVVLVRWTNWNGGRAWEGAFLIPVSHLYSHIEMGCSPSSSGTSHGAAVQRAIEPQRGKAKPARQWGVEAHPLPSLAKENQSMGFGLAWKKKWGE